MIHRAILGSIERFFGIVVEHFAGAFPMWLAPVQAVVMPLSEKFLDYGREVQKKMRAAGLRVTIDESNEKLGAKIRHGQLQKVPFMLVVGEKEASSGSVALRKRTGGDQGSLTVDEVIAEMQRMTRERVLTL
jgi:threonyl-tRNA synthetase